MICPNCKETKWKNVDHARIKPEGMELCEGCGFISYPKKWKSKEDIVKYYRNAYRQPPTHFNIFAGERKNHYHHAFLHDTFEKWRAAKFENPKILEIGSAFGFTLQWLRQLFPKAEITGTELTTSMRRVAAHEFGVKLDEDVDYSKKYDLIISYKVLEHQLDPDVELANYSKMLNPGGVFYLSIPTWFDTMSNFGAAGFDLEYYFDPNHVNVWTRKIAEGMFARAGFEIIKKDYVIYSSTYLLKSNPEIAKTAPIQKEDPKEIENLLMKVKTAFLLYTENQFQKAVEVWPNYPHAYIQILELNRKKLTELGWAKFKEQFVEKMISDCVDSGLGEAYDVATDFAMRANEWQDAVKYCELALKSKPENPQALYRMSNIMRELALASKNESEKLHYFIQALEVAKHLRNTSTQHFKEATDLIYIYSAQIPFKGETVERKN